MIAGVILAAGESRRMGFPKPLLPYKGTTFLGHLVETLRGQVDPLRSEERRVGKECRL